MVVRRTQKKQTIADFGLHSSELDSDSIRSDDDDWWICVKLTKRLTIIIEQIVRPSCSFGYPPLGEKKKRLFTFKSKRIKNPPKRYMPPSETHQNKKHKVFLFKPSKWNKVRTYTFFIHWKIFCIIKYLDRFSSYHMLSLQISMLITCKNV